MEQTQRLRITVYGSTDNDDQKLVAVLEEVARFEVKNGKLVIKHKGGDQTFSSWTKIEGLKTT
jgi:coenzyme F420-reducing hydrogenase beta subunit